MCPAMCLYPWVLDDAIGKEIQLKTLAPFYERVFLFFLMLLEN